GEKELPLRPNAFVQLGVKRQQESLRALASLGVPADHIHFLSFPNNGLLALWKADHWLPAATYRSPYTRADRSPYRLSLTPGAPYCGAQVVSDLVRLLGRVRPTLVFVTHPQDVHPDHWVTAACVQFALALLRQKGEAWAQGVRVYGYLIHWPGWPIPRTWQPKLGLVPPSDLLQVDDRPWFSVPLDHDVETAKARALRFYRSQEPSFDRLLLAFVRTNEAFALLGQPACPLHKSVCWIDEVTRLAIGGADVQGTCVRLDNNGSLSVNLVCASRRLPGKGYIAVDVRRWDERGRAVIATAYVKGPGQGYARFMFHDQLSIQPLSPLLLGPGQWSVKLVSLPGRAQLWEGAMATCWGSVGDRRTDPAPWPGSHPDGEETHAPGRYSSSAR
ncbi:MAG: PIG-L family deacetylase, partial [Armatimonadetes bacterium]|nr:PIG-L family deacetylase [Armatimonadota bacterium]